MSMLLMVHADARTHKDACAGTHAQGRMRRDARAGTHAQGRIARRATQNKRTCRYILYFLISNISSLHRGITLFTHIPICHPLSLIPHHLLLTFICHLLFLILHPLLTIFRMESSRTLPLFKSTLSHQGILHRHLNSIFPREGISGSRT